MQALIYAHLMAAAIGINGPTRARLQKTGALSLATKKYGLPMLLFLLIDGVVMLSALGYFSWAYLGWWPLLTFFVVYLAIGDRLGRLKSEGNTWVVMIVSLIVVAATEWLLWRQ